VNPTVVLRDLTQDAYAPYRVQLRDSYVEEMVSLAGREPESARPRPDRENEVYLPPEGPPPQQMIKPVELDGQRIGPAPDLSSGNPEPTGLAWLCDVQVDTARRGQGWGHVLLAQAERVAAELGFRRLGLNLFGGHERAIRFYLQDGYRVTSQPMAKDL
jgi:GNAT superfamily N-acetyltransferase